MFKLLSDKPVPPTQIDVIRINPEVEEAIKKYEKERSAPGMIPLIYDHSMISTMMNCPRKGFLSYVLHLKAVEMERPLSFGTAIHEGLKIFYEQHAGEKKRLQEMWKAAGGKITPQTPLERDALRKQIKNNALDHYVITAKQDPHMPEYIENEEKYRPHSIERGYKLLAAFIDQRPFDNELWEVVDPLDVEAGFAVIIGGTYVIVGRIDLIVILKQFREWCVVDHKTTTKLTQDWGDQWNPHNQLTTYCHGASELKGVKVRRGLINCLHFNKNIESVEKNYPTTRTDQDIEDWKVEVYNTVRWIENMYMSWYKEALIMQEELERGEGIAMAVLPSGDDEHLNDMEIIKTPDPERAPNVKLNTSLAHPGVLNFPKNTSHCDAYHKMCGFAKICGAGNPAMRDRIAAGSFIVKPWLPFEELGKRGIGTRD